MYIKHVSLKNYILRKKIIETVWGSLFPIVCALEHLDTRKGYEEIQWVWWANRLKNPQLNKTIQVLYVLRACSAPVP